MEGWLIKRGYNQTMVREQVLRARSFSREELLDQDRTKALNVNKHLKLCTGKFEGTRNLLRMLSNNENDVIMT